LVATVIITLFLGAVAFAVGSAWNNAMQEMAKRNKVPLWAYASSATLFSVVLVIALAFAARAIGIEENLGDISAAARIDPAEILVIPPVETDDKE
jgi:uncharacterized membrane protein YidH (DUF202 family)